MDSWKRIWREYKRYIIRKQYFSIRMRSSAVVEPISAKLQIITINISRLKNEVDETGKNPHCSDNRNGCDRFLTLKIEHASERRRDSGCRRLAVENCSCWVSADSRGKCKHDLWKWGWKRLTEGGGKAMECFGTQWNKKRRENNSSFSSCSVVPKVNQ